MYSPVSIITVLGAIIGAYLGRVYLGDGLLSAAIGGAVGGAVVGGISQLILEIKNKKSNISNKASIDNEISIVPTVVNEEVAVTTTPETIDLRKLNKPLYFGFGGWLYLYTLIQFYSLYTVTKSLKESYNLITSEELLPVYRSSGYSDIADRFSILGLFEMFFAVSIITIILLSWFFAIRISRFYKTTNIILYIWNLIGTIILYGLYMYTMNYMNVALDVNEPIFDSSMTRILIGTFIGTLIWVPYFMKSERVKNTFVR